MQWLINMAYYVLPFLVLLGILVFVHELGHFWVARLLGVKVDEFSIGFGKELWGRTDRKGTHWKIAAVPLGGYCKFFGDEDAASAAESEKLKDLSEEEKKHVFQFLPPFKKILIAVAGPAANYLFAVLVFTSIFMALGKMDFPPVVGSVIKGSAAEQGGIQANDRILTINGHKINNFKDINYEVTLAVDGKADVVLLRDGTEKEISLNLVPVEMKNSDGTTTSQVMLGIKSLSIMEVDHERLGFFAALHDASVETADITMATLRGVGQMITGKRGGEDVGGIIRIAEMSGDITKQNGLLDFVVFMALLSINLGLINLFPIPMLDGGHIVINLIELVTRRELGVKFKEILFKTGFALIMALMIFATWNDVVRLINRWFA
ncbi:MAG: RIP metalloprotease RseP [Pseudomonadota bacterium]|nr:RIP metalloprotease RseP [Pseudomonadota bacterium]